MMALNPQITQSYSRGDLKGTDAIGYAKTVFERIFKLPVENLGDSASVNALSEYIWNTYLPERNAYLEKQRFI